MRKIVLLPLRLILCCSVFMACVAPKYFSEVETEKNLCKSEREGLFAENEKLTVENTELIAKLELSQEAEKRSQEGSIGSIEELKDVKNRFEQLNKRHEELQASHKTIISGSDAETRNLMNRLDKTQKDLYQREDQLNQVQAKLDKDLAELEQLKKELEQNNARMIELKNILERKEAETEAIRKKVAAALTGFENQGLTITKKNGKVYVSLDEKLLFKSGSTDVDERGKSALKKLAGVLEKNRDINITIEGHTDEVKIISGSKYKDNWDLSVNRSTEIIRILLDGSSIDPKRLTASGRGEYLPVDMGKTDEARQKNRRTEIILTPNLDEIFDIIGESKQ